jgi:hypothetical protein
VNAGRFETCAHRSTGLDAGSRRGGPENDSGGSTHRINLVRDRTPDHRHAEHGLSGSFFGFSDRIGDTPRLSEADSNLALVVANHNENGPACGLSSLGCLEYFIRSDYANVKLWPVGISTFPLAAHSVGHSH